MKHGAETVASVRSHYRTDVKAIAPQTGALADAITALNKKMVAIAGEAPVAGAVDAVAEAQAVAEAAEEDEVALLPIRANIHSSEWRTQRTLRID